MGKTVKVPDPVYEEIDRQSDAEDVSHGTIVRDWMEAANESNQIEAGQ